MTRVAVVSPGALGAAVGKALASAGHTVRCDVGGRSAATQRRCADAGFIPCGSFREAVLESEILLSLVPPDQAVAVSCQFRQCMAGAPSGAGPRIYIDANSISPRTGAVVRRSVSNSGADAVKASFFGPASSLGKDNVVVLSGKSAGEAAALFAGLIDTVVAGEDFAAAAAVKMSMSIMTKTTPVLFLESMSAAAAGGQLGVTLELFQRLYPGMAGFLERTLPTYPRHVGRRLFEMWEIEAWLQRLGRDAPMTRSGRNALERLRLAEAPVEDAANFRQLVEALLRGPGPASGGNNGFAALDASRKMRGAH